MAGSYPHAHGHIQGEIDSNDDDVGDAQLGSWSMEVSGGVGSCHPAANTTLSPGTEETRGLEGLSEQN